LHCNRHTGQAERHLKAYLRSAKPEDDTSFIPQSYHLSTSDKRRASASRAISASDVGRGSQIGSGARQRYARNAQAANANAAEPKRIIPSTVMQHPAAAADATTDTTARANLSVRAKLSIIPSGFAF
jgi:hypothetical protein